MQRATVNSNQHAKNLAIGTGIAQAWLSALAADGTKWRSGMGSTTWLSTIATSNAKWQLPAWDGGLGFGPQFDAFGAPVQTAGVFCVHIRLTWLYGDASATQPAGIAGNGVVRSEVRVFWPKSGATRVANDCTTAAQATVDAVGAATGTYQFVTMTGATRQTL
jgi:hypothetical protein